MAGGAVVETTVDQTLMRGSEPHDRWYVVELPRSSELRRIGDPADSGCEGSPDRDRAPSLARKKHVDWFAGASLECNHMAPDQAAGTGTCPATAQTKPASSRAIAVVTTLAGLPLEASLR